MGGRPVSRWLMGAGWVAGVICAATLVVAGARLDGYSHALHPIGLPGAHGIAGASAFNLFGFVLPGLLAAALALGLYRMLPAAAGWLPRIGARMLLLSALAFAAQGLLPLDPQDLDGRASGLHASAWLLWWIAFVPGASLLATGLRGIGAITALVACALLAAAFAPSVLLEPPPTQRVALAAWLLWLALAPWLAARANRPRLA